MKKYKKMLWIVLGIIVVTVLGYGLLMVGIDNYQYQRNQKVISTLKTDTVKSKTLVVFFSRSGTTELMARKIAAVKGASVVPLRSQRDGLSLKGLVEAIQDARKTEAEITPSKIDLSSYDTIYIGSPVWLYSPAPPVYEFAKRNDFTGKNVILFNSMNSKFEQKYIGNFRNIIEKNGGVFEKHLYIIRGRVTQQMDTDTFLKKVEEVIK